nr:MAG: putative maturation protein [Leviviridae sp.]
MSTRTRSNYVYNNFGKRYLVVDGVPSGTLNANVRVKLWECTDEDHGDHHHANTFFNTLQKSDVDYVNGIRTDGIYAGSGYTSFPAFDLTAYGGHNSNQFTDKPSQGEFNRLVAGTNPSRSAINPLMAAQDLIDLPKLINSTLHFAKKGRRAANPRDIANMHLATSFGWLPLIDDVKTLLDLQHTINRRMREVHEMNRKGGQTRSLKFGTSHNITRSNISLLSSVAAGSMSGRLTKSTTATRWGSIRWVPTQVPTSSSDIARENRTIRRAVEGLTYNDLVAGAWDYVPWSFMVDWFTNTGSFIKAHANSIPARYEDACIMTHTHTDYNLEVTSRSAWLSGGSGSAQYDSKSRYRGTAGIGLSIPFLGAGKLSILASLFAQRLSR